MHLREQKQTAVELYKHEIYKPSFNFISMKKIISALFLVIFLTSVASASTFINVYIDNTGGALFLGETDESQNTLTFPSGVSINSRSEIVGRTNVLTSKSEDLWTFSYELPGTELNIILPEGAIIKSLSEGVEISLEGERIQIFALNSLEVSYEIGLVQTPGISSTIVPLLLVLIASIFILIIYLFNIKKIDGKEPKKVDIEHLLNKREKLILAKVKETGKIKSSQLRKLTEIPKASFSRHVQELEKKKLIQRSGEGKNKFIELN